MYSFTQLIKITLTTLLFLFFAACSSEDKSTKKPQELTIAFASWPGFDIIYYAQEADLFKKHNLNVKLIKYPDQESATKAIQNLEVDAAMISIWDAMMLDGDHKYDIILATNVSNGADGIVAQKEIKSIKDLKGKKVSTVKNSVNELILLEALQTQDMSLEDINVIDISNEEGVAKLFHKEIDASVVWEPLLSKTKKKIHGNIIFTTKDVNSSVIDVLVVDHNSLQQKKQQWRKFLFAWYEMMDQLKHDAPSVMRIVSEKTINPSFAQDYAGLKAGDIQLNKEIFLNNKLQMTFNTIKQFIKLDKKAAPIIINKEFVQKVVYDYENK